MQSVTLVGRTGELAGVGRRLAAARAGSGSVLLIEGDAGAGKTALAHALAGQARATGMLVSWGGCLEGDGAGAYRPWIQVLRELGEPTDALVEAGGDHESRFSRFDSLVSRLRGRAEPAGLLLVLDDLHWADIPSVRLLQAVTSIATDSRLLVVGLYRGHEAFRYGDRGDALRAVSRDRSSSTISLGALQPAEVDELIEQTLGRRPDDATARAVRERADGNPLFVLELLRLMSAAGDRRRLPRSIRDVIGSRLDLLTQDARRVLRAAAVLGRESTMDALVAVSGQPRRQVLDAIDDAVEAELVTRPDPRRTRFGHVLTAEVLYGELPTHERRQLHSRASAALVAADSLDARAYHLREAADDPVEALRVTRAAAHRARGLLAYEHAAFQLREALGLVAGQLDLAGLRAELLLELARCEFRAGAVDDAWRSCQEAADLGRAAGDPAVLADAATVLIGISNSPVTAQIHALCQEALALLDSTDAVRHARVLAQLAVTVNPFAGPADPDLGRKALLAAEATGDPDARFLALQARHTELVDGRHVLDRLSVGERAIALGRETGVGEYTGWGHAWRLGAFWELGRRVPLDAEIAGLGAVVDQLRDPLWRWRLLAVHSSVALQEGRFAAARELADEALDVGRRAGHEAGEFVRLVFESEYSLVTGDRTEEVTAQVRRHAAQWPFLARAWWMMLLARTGRLDEAARGWPAIAPQADAMPRGAPEWLIGTAGIAELAVLFADRGVAALLYDLLLPYADRQVVFGGLTPNRGPVALRLGELATLLGDWPAAHAHLRTAVASSSAMAAPPHEAQARLATARFLLARGGPGDRDAAVVELDHAGRTAGALGMSPLAAEVRAVRDSAVRAETAVLSARELEVAGLVALGLSNRQIAHRLHLSERTAANHVGHILTKLGFESRTRIAVWYAGRQK